MAACTCGRDLRWGRRGGQGRCDELARSLEVSLTASGSANAEAMSCNATQACGVVGLGGSAAVCMLGQGRVLEKPLLWQSHANMVMRPLREAARLVHLFAVLDPVDNRSEINALFHVAGPLPATEVRYVGLKGHPDQYLRFALCRELMEHHRPSGYDWVVRIRPDNLFFSPLPPLSRVDPFSIHSRMRCYCPMCHNFSPDFSEDAISSEFQSQLRHVCNRTGSCACRLAGCGVSEPRLDDQVALVPRVFVRVYFQNHRYGHGLSNITGGPLGSTACVTHAVLAAGASIRPIPLRYSLARLLPKTLKITGNAPAFMRQVSDGVGGTLYLDCPTYKVNETVGHTFNCENGVPLRDSGRRGANQSGTPPPKDLALRGHDLVKRTGLLARSVTKG